MKIFWSLLLGVVACAASACTPSTKSAAVAEQALSVDSSQTAVAADTARVLTIAVCGDIMMGTTYPSVQLPANGGADLFRDAAPILRAADVACGNLEGAMTDGGTSTKRGGANSYSFRMPTSFAPLLTEAGFDFLSLANNHANDFGDAGIASTERCLREQGIGYAGIKGHPEVAVKEINGVSYGFCAFGHNRYTLRTQETAEVQRIVRSLASRCDIVIVSFHGGAEGSKYKHLPNGTETFLGENRGDLRHFARVCIDAGADLVFGHGPHVVRAVDMYKGRFIAYSLGNFCTPYGMSLNGVNAYAPIIEVKMDGSGNFLEGRIHSLVQTRGVGPRKDSTHAPAREIKVLTEADVPSAALRIHADGRIEKK